MKKKLLIPFLVLAGLFFTVTVPTYAQCATVTSVSTNVTEVEAGKLFNCQVTVDSGSAGSRNIACGIRFTTTNGRTWPQNFCPSDGTFFGGWNGNTASFNCVVPDTNVQADSIELVGFDFQSQCGPDMGKAIPIKFKTSGTVSSTSSNGITEQLGIVKNLLLNLFGFGSSAGGTATYTYQPGISSNPNFYCPNTGNPSSGGTNYTPPAKPTAQISSCPSSSQAIQVPNTQLKYSTVRDSCIKPSMMVIHWVAAWQPADIPLQYLNSVGYACQFITDENKQLQTLGFYQNQVERGACVAGYNDYTINNELSGINFDEIFNNPQHPGYKLLMAETQKALDSTCWAMQQYNICPRQVYGHLELNPDTKFDPGKEYIKYFRGRLEKECAFASQCVNPGSSQGGGTGPVDGANFAFARNTCGITTQTPVKGPPTISAAKIDQILASYKSPATGLGQKIYDMGVKYGIDPAYVIAQFIKESSAGTPPNNNLYAHNVGNIRCRKPYPYPCDSTNTWIQFDSWEQGFEGLYQHLTQNSTLYFKAGNYHVESIIPIWAPPQENDTCLYIKQTIDRMNSWKGQ